LPFAEFNTRYSVFATRGWAHEMVRGGTVAIVSSIVATSMLLALPVTRRRCNVRVEHLWRIGAHAPAPWLPSIVAPLLWSLMALPTGNPSAMALDFCDVETQWAIDTLFFVSVLLTPIWWFAAIGKYLRLPHAIPVACVCAGAGLLAGI